MGFPFVKKKGGGGGGCGLGELHELKQN